jgi:hypothetical protein
MSEKKSTYIGLEKATTSASPFLLSSMVLSMSPNPHKTARKTASLRGEHKTVPKNLKKDEQSRCDAPPKLITPLQVHHLKQMGF